MKHIITILLFFIVTTVNAQFSIRVNSTNIYAVDILYKAPALGQGNIPVQFFEFALQIANPQGATLTATFTPGAPLAAIATFTPYTGIDNGKTTWAWAAAGVPNYSNTFNFTATEVVLGTVAFTPTAIAAGADVFAVDYQNAPTYGGAGTGVAIWTMQVRPIGDDVTNYGSLFYQSANAGIIRGSAAPNTNADYGTSNQQVGLTGGTLLPLNLLSFTATQKNCNASIAWKTADEVNSKNFEVQTSTNGTSFTTTATIAAKGGTTSNYSTILPQQAGTVYYRLKMVDKDGKFTYSTIVPLAINCQPTDNMSLYPNPVKNDNTTTLSFNTSYKGMATIKITNTLGQQLSALQTIVVSGLNNKPIATTNLAAGVYYVSLVDAKGSVIGTTQKLIKQ
jgi:hypothetical protein